MKIKMRLASKIVRDATPKAKHVEYHLTAVRDESNSSWSKGIPAGMLQISVTNPEAKDLEDGEYVVTIERLAKASKITSQPKA